MAQHYHPHHHHHQQQQQQHSLDHDSTVVSDSEHLLANNEESTRSDQPQQRWFDASIRRNSQPQQQQQDQHDSDEDEGSIRFSVNCTENDLNGAMTRHQESTRQRKIKETLQQKLRFHFMSPIDKWRIKRRVPLKLFFQFAKILFVTMQILYFGNEMSCYLKYEDNTRTAFRQSLLAGWDPTREVFAYPPSTGAFAVYTSQDFYANIDFAIKKYSNMSAESVGNFAYDFVKPPVDNSSVHPQYPRIIFEKRFYRKRTVDPSKYIFNFDDFILRDDLVIENLYPASDPKWLELSSLEYFSQNNFSVDFNTLVGLKMKFPLRTIYFNTVSDYGKNVIRCYALNITIEYDNSEFDGLIQVKLATERTVHQCKNETLRGGSQLEDDIDNESALVEQIQIYRQHRFVWPHVLNWIVLVFCVFSAILCVRSLYRGQILRQECAQFFNQFYHQPLDWEEFFEFVDISIVTIVLNDILIICGTYLKIQLESIEVIDSQIYTRCSLFLGLGNLLIWLGLLRYLSYFRSYNILIITVRKALPNVFRFLVCVFLLYGGFCFCGWIVLGPHHLKFRTLSSTAECLFSLMNGDDMFATFYSADVAPSSLIWWFSRLYLYIFISFSIYVIVSIFIAIILDSYEVIRDYYGRPEEIRSRLQKFADEVPTDSIDGRSFSNDSIVDQIYRQLARIFCRS